MSDTKPTDMAPVALVAKAMNLTPRRLQQLGLEGVIPRAEGGKLPVLVCLSAYIRHLQTRASEGSKKLSEDKRLRSAQADLRELDLKKARSEVIDAGAVTAVIVEVMALLKRRILSIGARLAGLLDGRRSAEAKKVLDDEAIAILEDICAGLVELEERIGGRKSRGRPAQKANGRRVGRPESGAPQGLG